jgi:release factor glutamine methyltransferase
MTPSEPKTVKAVLEAGAAYLAAKGIGQDPRHVTELLLARLLRCKRLELYLRYDAELGERHLEAMRRGLRRLAQGEPVQYVLGETEFMGHPFKVDRRALIPRPETEGLVVRVLAYAPLWSQERPAVVDVGTGSGCIALSLALARPAARYLALDTSADALALARENAAALGVGDKVIFAAAELPDVMDAETADAVVANLPYVATAEYEALPVHIRDFEPRAALDGGPDGLSAIEAVVQDAAIALRPGGALFLEIGAQQAARVAALLGDAGFESVTVEPDLAGRDRIVWGALPPA